ncbi:MAG TPA: CdaR family protein [Bacilli bacterium]|nr:CdaR family protein [Bacilli bacterium]
MSKRKLKKGLFIKIGNFFRSIYKFFDKIIITPVTKLMLFIMKLFKSNNKPLERFLNNKIVLISLSLVLAFIAFYVVDQQTDIILNKSADILYNQKVSAIYNEEAYVIEGLPETVNITLIGRQSDLYLAKQYPSEEVVVDLRELKPGTHKVTLQYPRTVNSVEYQLSPSTVSIVIYEKVSQSEKLTAEVLHERDLDTKYSINSVSLSREEVYVKGAKYKLEKVAIVKAMIDIDNIVNPNVGTTVLKEVPLIAYDASGEILDVEIVPSAVDATIDIESPEKTVPFKVIPEGNVVFGKAIDTISISKESVKIYGDSDILNGIAYVPVKVDVSNLGTSKEYNVTVTKPVGVRDLSVSTVTVKITLADITETTLTELSIGKRNLDTSKYSAQAASKEDSVVDVIVKGTKNALKQLSSETVSAYVDLTGLTAGTHEVEILVDGDDLRLSYAPKTKTATIIITKK